MGGVFAGVDHHFARDSQESSDECTLRQLRKPRPYTGRLRDDYLPMNRRAGDLDSLLTAGRGCVTHRTTAFWANATVCLYLCGCRGRFCSATKAIASCRLRVKLRRSKHQGSTAALPSTAEVVI